MIMYEIFDGDHRSYHEDEISALRMADMKAEVTDYGMNGFIFVDKLTIEMAGKELALAILNDESDYGLAWISERERIYERMKPNA